MLSNRIGHAVLTKRYEAAKLEIRRMRDLLRRRDETISKLRSTIADAKQVEIGITNTVQRPPVCGCRHCIEVAGRRLTDGRIES